MTGPITGISRIFVALVIFAAIGVAAIGPGRMAVAQKPPNLARFPTETLIIQSASGQHRFSVEIARSDRQQAQGLMYRRRLGAASGMLFLHDPAQRIAMWMRNTFIPLDMLFIGGDGKISRIVERTVPHSLATISSGGPVRAVLEVNGGTVRRLKLRRGDPVIAPSLAR